MTSLSKNKASIFSPAKINLFLAITGLQNNGYRKIVSVVDQVNFGDILSATEIKTGNEDILVSNSVEIPHDENNLILKAAKAYRHRNKRFNKSIHFELDKKIPVGSGLGGGSSNAVATLTLLNKFSDCPVDIADLVEIAESIGSDCPLFFNSNATIVRGRGEIINPLPTNTIRSLSSNCIIIFKPNFEIETSWAYSHFQTNSNFDEHSIVESKLQAWLNNEITLDEFCYNRFEKEIFKKYLALPALFDEIKKLTGIRCHMSGSGSACFAFYETDTESKTLTDIIKDCLGDDAFICQTTLK